MPACVGLLATFGSPVSTFQAPLMHTQATPTLALTDNDYWGPNNQHSSGGRACPGISGPVANLEPPLATAKSCGDHFYVLYPRPHPPPSPHSFYMTVPSSVSKGSMNGAVEQLCRLFQLFGHFAAFRGILRLPAASPIFCSWARPRTKSHQPLLIT